MLEKLRKRQKEILAELRKINDAVEKDNRTELTDKESKRYDELRAERKRLDKRVEQLEEEEERRAKVAAGNAKHGVTGDGLQAGYVTYEPKVYDRHSRNSYFLDVARFQLSRGMDGAEERLRRHAQELDVELPKRLAAQQRRAEAGLGQLDREFRREYRRDPAVESFFGRGADTNPELRVNPNRVDGQGGYFVPPLWLVDEVIPCLRNGRPFASSLRNIDLPAGTDSINVPKVQTGATVGVQTDGGAISDTDITDNFVTAPVRTLAGQQDIAMQLLDQSPVAFDEIMMSDLLADYARVIDLQCWQGTGANGQLLGIDNVAGVNAVTYTSGSPTITGLYPILGQAISQLAKNRKRADGISWWMQAPRWYWIASSLDSQNRPFIIPMDQGSGFNPLATQLDLAAEGPIGRIFGAPSLLDMNITTVDGVSVNQDRMYPIRTQDLYLFEGQMRTRALTEVLSGTLQVRIQVYNYVALLSTRYPSSISVITGTGLVNPTGF